MEEIDFSSSEEDENEVTILHHYEPLSEENGLEEHGDTLFAEDETCEPNDSAVEEIEKIENTTPCPCVGIEFNSHEEAYDFYNRYAFDVGFSVRKNTTTRSKITGNLIGRTFCCSLEGYRDSRAKQAEERTRDIADTRTGCKALMTVRKNKKGEKWTVTKFMKGHNHNPVTPSKKHLLRSQRHIEETQKTVMDGMNVAGIRAGKVVEVMAKEAGGSRNMGFTKKDVSNYLASKREKDLSNGDAQALLHHLQQQQLDNPAFFYAIQIDSEGHMTNFVWADAQSRMDYQLFGDVVCFDATYGTNMYEMPFVPIVGINHHYQTVLFGGALLFSETEESYMWVVDTWLRAMDGKQPKVILTDRESAVAGAIRKILPDTQHRYCLWHINRNALSNLAKEFHDHPNLHGDLSDCFYAYETVEQFHFHWNAMIQKYGLQNNTWLKTLFGISEQWAFVHRRHLFCAGMYTTQRSESINAYFDKYLRIRMPLIYFMREFERAVVDRREEENKEDNASINARPVLRFGTTLEMEAAAVYTRSIFKKFLEQMTFGFKYRHKKISENEQVVVYNVWMEGYEYKVRTIVFEPSTMNIKCSCQLFEFAGYLCRHILKIFVVEDVQNLPKQYVLDRWTKFVKADSAKPSMSENNQVSVKEETTASRYFKLCQRAVRIASKASGKDEVCKVALSGLDKTMIDVENAMRTVSFDSSVENEGPDTRDGGEPSLVSAPLNSQIQLLDPQLVKHKGKSKRIKSYLDKGPKNKNQKKNNDANNAIQKKGNNSTRSRTTRGRAPKKGTRLDNLSQDANNDVGNQDSQTIAPSEPTLKARTDGPNVTDHHRPHGNIQFDLNKIFEDPDA